MINKLFLCNNCGKLYYYNENGEIIRVKKEILSTFNWSNFFTKRCPKGECLKAGFVKSIHTGLSKNKRMILKRRGIV